jgi:hypothetical protein
MGPLALRCALHGRLRELADACTALGRLALTFAALKARREMARLAAEVEHEARVAAREEWLRAQEAALRGAATRVQALARSLAAAAVTRQLLRTQTGGDCTWHGLRSGGLLALQRTARTVQRSWRDQKRRWALDARFVQRAVRIAAEERAALLVQRAWRCRWARVVRAAVAAHRRHMAASGAAGEEYRRWRAERAAADAAKALRWRHELDDARCSSAAEKAQALRLGRAWRCCWADTAGADGDGGYAWWNAVTGAWHESLDCPLACIRVRACSLCARGPTGVALQEAEEERPGPEAAAGGGGDDGDEFRGCGGAGVFYCQACWDRVDDEALEAQHPLPAGWTQFWEAADGRRRRYYANELTGERQLERPTKSAAQIAADAAAAALRQRDAEEFEEPSVLLQVYLDEAANEDTGSKWRGKGFARPADMVEYVFYNNHETEPRRPAVPRAAPEPT